MFSEMAGFGEISLLTSDCLTNLQVYFISVQEELLPRLVSCYFTAYQLRL